MEYAYVVLAGVAGYVFGAIWYGALGKRWQAEVGLSPEDVKPASNVSAYLVALLGNLLVAGMMRHIFVTSGVDGTLNAAVSGLGLGLFIAGSYLMLNYAFAKRSTVLSLIDIGHAAGSATVIAVVLDALT
ncbi:MAG: DUF1761 domain-containing protein [Pseudomonadota bacterium]